MEWLRRIIRETVATLAKPKDGVVVHAQHHRLYFPVDKLVSLGINYINKYGFITPHDNEKTTYERLITAINRDPSLMQLEVNHDMVKEFLNAVRTLDQRYFRGTQGLFMQKVRIMLHAPSISMGRAYYVLYALSYFLNNKRKENSYEVEKDTTFVLKVKLVDAGTRAEANTQYYDFVDGNGVFYRKLGNPPPIYSRLRIGSKKKLVDEPYELFYNDAFQFKAKIVDSRVNKRGQTVNIIRSIQPIL